MKVKYLFRSMLAMAGVFAATSCSQEELYTETEGDIVEASFTIETPDAILSRAIGDGTTVDQVTCAVFDANGKEMESLRKDIAIVGKKAQYNVRLAKGQDYRVAFFAYDKDANAYDVSNMKDIKVTYGKSNLENRDAFTAVVEVEATTAAINKGVTLYRPFAQLNLGAYPEDIEAAKNAGIVVKKSQVTVTNVYSAFNAYEDKVAGETTTVTFGLDSIPTQDLEVDINRDNTITDDEIFAYLALNYILVGDKGSEKSLADIKFTWETADGKTNNPISTFENIPVQRNYRTNIVGWLLTNPAEFNIVIDEEFTNSPEDDYNIMYVGGTEANPAKLEEVFTNINDNELKDAIIKVPANNYVSWTTGGGLGSTPLVTAANTATETVTIEGEGENSVIIVDGAGVGSIRAANGAKLIFKNITVVDNSVSYAEGSWEFTYLEFAGNLECNNVTFKGGIQLQKEGDENDLNATFTNCTFITEKSSEYSVWICDGTTTFSNCKFKGTRGLKMHEAYGSEIAVVTVDACEFGPLSEKPGIAIGTVNAQTAVTIKNSSFIGCQAGDQGNNMYETDTNISTFTFVESNNSVEADPANVVKIGTKAELIAFQNAVNVDGNSFGGKTIKLTADIDLEGMEWKPIGQTGGNGVKTHFSGSFDGQGYTISNFTINPDPTYGAGKNYAAGLFGFVDAGDAVIKNLNVNNATVNGHHWTAVICGYLTGSVQNCHVTNSHVVCSHANDDACGDKAGMIVGYINEGSVKDCTAKNGTVKAGRDAGQIVGMAVASNPVEGCSAENVVVSALGDCTGANVNNDIVGRK